MIIIYGIIFILEVGNSPGERKNYMQKIEDNREKAMLFEKCIEPIYGELYRFIYSIVRNKELAEDAMQNTFLNAYIYIFDVRDDNKFKSWIFTIAKRESIKVLRLYNRELPTDSEDFIVYMNENTDFNIPHDVVIRKELNDKLIEIINNMDAKYRDVAILKYGNGLTLAEISEILNTNINTVKTWHRRLKNIIYKELASYMSQDQDVKVH